MYIDKETTYGQRKLKWIGSEDNKYKAKAGLTIKCIRALGKIRQFEPIFDTEIIFFIIGQKRPYNNNLSYQYKSLIQTRQNALVGSTKIKGVSKGHKMSLF